MLVIGVGVLVLFDVVAVVLTSRATSVIRMLVVGGGSAVVVGQQLYVSGVVGILVDGVVDVEGVEVEDEAPGAHLQHVLDDEDHHAVQPHPQRYLLPVLVVPQATHWHVIQRSTGPHQCEGGG